MLSHSISPLINSCHFLINPVTKPFSPKMTENNQSFFSILPDILLQKPKINCFTSAMVDPMETMTTESLATAWLAEMTGINQR